MLEIQVPSSLDGSIETSLLHLPSAGDKAPLVVGLHSWSFGRTNQIERMLPYVQELGWGLLLPEFRGANLATNPRASEACASELAKQDIVDALTFVCTEHADTVDPERVLLLGGSGGGHMALCMAGHRPELWAMVSSWCPITDVGRWHSENPNYVAGMEACCGGAPDERPDEYRQRSPVACIDTIAKANVSIYHGRWDPSVPYGHSLDLYTELVERHPDAAVYLSIFDGGHELLYEIAFRSFEQAVKKTPSAGLTG